MKTSEYSMFGHTPYLLAITAIVLSTAGLTSIPAMAIEKPEFRLLETIVSDEAQTEIEIRAYPSLNVARTRVAANFSKAGNQGFRRLGGYIFGANESDTRISMTAPVAQSAAGDDAYWVTFFMPEEHSLDSLPVPVDESVTITSVPARTLAVIRYRGGWSEKKFRDHEQQLLAALTADGQWQVQGESIWARYNPPITPSFLRTNEVMVPVARIEKK